MEQKKEDKNHEEKNNFDDLIFWVNQKLIKIYKKIIKNPSGNFDSEYSKLIEDLTKNDFPKITKLYNEEKQKNEELTESLQRLQAEFENYRKRIEKEKEEFVKYAKADLIEKLLPILDSFESAFKNTKDKDKFIKGTELIFAQLCSLLQSEGLRQIKAVGEKLDPYRHEVLLKQESEKEDDIILEELQKGYMLNDKVLRHSKVKVSKKSKNNH